MLDAQDHRYLDACLRYARRHSGITGTNPSVGTLLIKDDVVVGRGITARGGRPHAERIAIDRAGSKAVGSTAYVSLEPCAHHGATPPCAQALIDAGVVRVVTAWTDPDSRVDGRGHKMLLDAGLRVDVDDTPNTAADDLRGYLNRKQKNRPQVTLKLAVSRDGMLGLPEKEIPITGKTSRAMVHRLRAQHDGILVGRGTVKADDPELTCRLPGLFDRSPHRFVLDTDASLIPGSKLAQSAKEVPVSVITRASGLGHELTELGVRIFRAESHEGKLALPEILEDMAESGLSSLMVEGGATTARSFLMAELIDELYLFTAPTKVGTGGIASPITKDTIPSQFELARELVLGDDTLQIYRRK